MIFFLDSSAVVKRYVQEPGTAVVRALFRGRRQLAAARVTAVEVAAALARRARSGDLDSTAAHRQSERALGDLGKMHVVELRAPVVQLAVELGWKHPLRAFDAIQLGSALHLMRATGLALTFVCADRGLCDVAKLEGARVLVAE